jgi:hypothetical protein
MRLRREDVVEPFHQQPGRRPEREIVEPDQTVELPASVGIVPGRPAEKAAEQSPTRVFGEVKSAAIDDGSAPDRYTATHRLVDGLEQWLDQAVDGQHQRAGLEMEAASPGHAATGSENQLRKTAGNAINQCPG